MTNNTPKNNLLIKNQKEIELERIKEDLEDLEIYIEEFSRFLPLAICTVNPLRKIININEAFSDLTGYDEIEIIGEDTNLLFLDKKEAQVLEEEVFEKKKVLAKETAILTKGNKRIPVNVSGSIRKDREDNIIGYFLAFSDISEIKQFQERLEERVKERTKELESSRKALTNILEDIYEAREKTEEEKNKTVAIITNFADGLLVFDEKNNLSLINPQAEYFFGVKGKDIIGKSIPELFKINNLKPLMDIFGKEIKEIFRQELILREDLILEVSTIPIIREKEKLGNLVILHNITREKLIEKTKTEFVSLTAHQLRTPLSAIKWTLKMFLDEDLGRINKEQRDFLQDTYKSNERMISLINDLLNVTRIEEGRYLYKITPADIEDIIMSAVKSYAKEIAKKGLKIIFKKPAKKLPKIKVDVEKIKLALQNLLDNSIKYNNSGGSVTISLKHGRKEIEVQIKDTGVGIPKVQRERVFTKFFRGANVIRMETEGSGLGLYITKNIIEAHGGKIWFESKEDKGTTFHFTIPIKEEFAEFLKKF